MTKVILKKGREESLRRFHPWVFSGAIAQIVGSPNEGDIVGVYASDGSFLASGHYQIGAQFRFPCADSGLLGDNDQPRPGRKDSLRSR